MIEHYDDEAQKENHDKEKFCGFFFSRFILRQRFLGEQYFCRC